MPENLGLLYHHVKEFQCDDQVPVVRHMGFMLKAEGIGFWRRLAFYLELRRIEKAGIGGV